MRPRRTIAAVFAMSLSMAAMELSAATFTVTLLTDSPGLGPLGSLRRAVANANAAAGADIIAFSVPANSTIALNAGRLTVSDTLLVDGATATDLTISGGWNNVDNTTVGSRIFYTGGTFAGTLEVRRLTLTNGNAGAGGNFGAGQCLDGPQTSSNGGAFCIGNGTVILDQVRVTNSTANDGGAIQLINGSLQIARSTFDNNKARDDAGAIQVDNGTVAIRNSTFAFNSAGFGTSGAPPGTGGFMRIDNGSANLDHVTVAYNSADQFGVVDRNGGASVSANNSLFVGNNATQAGQEDGCDTPIALGGSWGNNDAPASLTPGNASCAIAGNTDAAANIALSNALAIDGGVTATLALGVASTVRGRLGPPCALPADQRDVVRGAGGEDCEPGAYELNPDPTDLSVSKTNNVASLDAGATTTYLIVIGNAGPASMDNAVLRDIANAELTLTAVACTASTGGATCPAAGVVTLANILGPGIAIPTLPVGATLTFTVTATVN